jgi:hypothetical protein
VFIDAGSVAPPVSASAADSGTRCPYAI